MHRTFAEFSSLGFADRSCAMPCLTAQRLNSDGLFRYGVTVLDDDLRRGPAFVISVEGQGAFPPMPASPVTEQQHRAWLGALQRSGFVVHVEPVRR